MQTLRWLRQMVPGFDQISAIERAAIRDFALLWSLFEVTVFATSANATRILGAVHLLRDQGRLDLAPFQRAIEPFRQRYYDGHSFTPAFSHLNLRRVDNRPLVEAFVVGGAIDDAESLASLLIIVYRLRNNLFDGMKWDYGLRGQLENFRHANHSLAMMEAQWTSHPARHSRHNDGAGSGRGPATRPNAAPAQRGDRGST
jgi:hypothetical protein